MRNARRQAAAAQNQGNTVDQSRATVAAPRSSPPTVAQTSSSGPSAASRPNRGTNSTTTTTRPSRPNVGRSSSFSHTVVPQPNQEPVRDLTRSTTTTTRPSRPTAGRSSSFNHTVVTQPNQEPVRGRTRPTSTNTRPSRPTVKRSSPFRHTEATQLNQGTMRGRSRTSRSLSGEPSRSIVDSAGQTSRSTVDSQGQQSPSTVDSAGQSSLSNMAYSAGQKLLEIGTSLFESANSHGQPSDADSPQANSSAGTRQSNAYDLLFSDADNMTANHPSSTSSSAPSTSAGIANDNDAEEILLEHAIAESLKLKEKEDIERATAMSIAKVRNDFRNKTQLSINPDEYALQEALLKQAKKERKMKKRYKRGAFHAVFKAQQLHKN
ncbi:hypothetical protein niasHT_012504 [Heterodera trifolii]|uniref:Uncharacterized protein n=1 Tax=Heterodera trifolii TaxID=157864 RepID=A0ABD2LCJ2_9BILA